MSGVPDAPTSITWMDPWPYSEMPKKFLFLNGPWVLYMDPDGAMLLSPRNREVPVEYNVVEVCAGEKGELEDFLVTHCQRSRQGNETYYFNWVSRTLAQVCIASQVADAHLRGKVREAWVIGADFGRRIEEARRALRG